MGKNRMELRRQHEAAEKKKTATGKTDAKKTKKRKAAKRKTTPRKSKDRALQRKRVVWCVFNGSMKEEGRFPYDQKEAAEAKLEQLRSKSKKLYFLQPVKEVMGDAPAPAEAVPDEDEVEETAETETDGEVLEDAEEEADDSDEDDDDGDDED